MTVKIKNSNPIKERNCLRCRETFMSEGFHNRICDKCKESDNFDTDFAFSADVGAIGTADHA